MTKELLTNNRTGPPSHNPTYQQSDFRHSAPCLTCRHFVNAVNNQRQDVGEQKPDNNGIGCKNTASRCQDQQQITTAIKIHIIKHSKLSTYRRRIIRDTAERRRN